MNPLATTLQAKTHPQLQTHHLAVIRRQAMTLVQAATAEVLADSTQEAVGEAFPITSTQE